MSTVRALAMSAGVSLVFGLGGVARADIYQTVDEDGVIVFTSKPRPGSKKVAVDSSSPSVSLPKDVSPERFHRYDAFIREAATLYQIPEELVRAVILVESNYDPRAVSHAGAIGLMQLMPGTAQTMMVEDIYDPRQNILGGVRYLRVLANMFQGDIMLTVAGYNAGENAVIRYGGIPPYPETQGYVVKVVENYQRYREASAQKAAAERR
jgi:soluble lytic murein transglycosylase-like protein